MRLSKCFKNGILCEYALVNGDCISEDGCHKFDIAEKLIETSSWHTGTPTEDGWYLQCIKSKNNITYDTDYYENGDWKYSCIFREIVAWQKIEPYEESEERKK